jgi:hypothetical protein
MEFALLAANPANAKALAYLSLRNPGAVSCLPPEGVPNPYYNCGCHPDIVERLWDGIGKALPHDCRCIVYGRPALVHPFAGMFLGLGIGTQYGLHLPGEAAAAAIRAGATTTTRWSGGSTMDIRAELGDAWVFGKWLAEELEWCREAFAMADKSSRKDA